MTKITFDQLFEQGQDIRVHGNGFIQIDLPPLSRVHVWGHPSIPRQVVSSQIHDHTFGFASTVLVGAIVNVAYEELSGDDYEVWAPTVREGQDTVLNDTGKRLSLWPMGPQIRKAGERYAMAPYVFHETFVNQPTITLMTKAKSSGPVGARVLMRPGQKPDNDFNRYSISRNSLWTIVREVFELGQVKELAA